jgi:transcriptional regulator with XRE-family HTH domain
MKTLERLRKEAFERPLTRYAFAKLINCDRINIVNWEEGKFVPSLESLLKLCDAFESFGMDFPLREFIEDFRVIKDASSKS